MTHVMPKLPYTDDALAPVMSKETIDYHYGKHLQTYIDNLNRLIADTPYADMTLDEIVKVPTVRSLIMQHRRGTTRFFSRL